MAIGARVLGNKAINPCILVTQNSTQMQHQSELTL